MPRLIYDFDKEGLEAFFVSLGQKGFRAGQMLTRVYGQGVTDVALMTEFAAGLRETLARELDFTLPLRSERQESVDGTVKLLYGLSDGEMVETVLIPDEDRLTQCVSTQAGCAMGCAFCRTATGGFSRNLTAGEIVSQILAGEQDGGFGKRPTNVVFMGMGEPLHNLENTVRAFDIISADWGLGIGRKKITVSTCGLADRMLSLPERMLPSLAVSLNATTDEVRDAIMPVNRRFPIKTLMDALKSLKLPPRAMITIEYVLLGGVNDTIADAKRLAKLLAGLKAKINLIPFNPHGDDSYRAPSPEAVKAFQTLLLEKNFIAVLRKSRGGDILAACGQLKAKAIDENGP